VNLKELNAGDLVIVLNCTAPRKWSKDIKKWWISKEHIGSVLQIHEIDRAMGVPELILRVPGDPETGRWATISNIMLVSKKE
jgi:hypothetical protein